MLHGRSLNEYKKKGVFLFGVYNVKVADLFALRAYPYTYGEQEGHLDSLAAIKKGFHAWDLNEMTKISNPVTDPGPKDALVFLEPLAAKCEDLSNFDS